MDMQDYFIELAKLKAKTHFQDGVKNGNGYKKETPEFKAYEEQMKELENGTRTVQ